MSAPALTPEQIVKMYKTAAFAGQNGVNGVSATIAAKNLVHTTRTGSLKNIPGAYNTMLQAGVRVSPVVPTRGTTRKIVQDNGATPVVNNATNFGLDGFSHAIAAASPIVADAAADSALGNSPNGTPLGFVPGGDLDGPMAPNMGLRVDTSQVDQDPTKKPDHDHDEKFNAMVQKYLALPPNERSLAVANSGLTPDQVKALQNAIDAWEGHHKHKHEKEHDLFAAKKPHAAPDDPKGAKKKEGTGTPVAHAAPRVMPHPAPPTNV